MTKWRTEANAIRAALERKSFYGLCVLDGFYYTGTAEQLEKIACIYIKEPS